MPLWVKMILNTGTIMRVNYAISAFQTASPIIAHSIIGPAARLPIQWLRVLLQFMISQKGGWIL